MLNKIKLSLIFIVIWASPLKAQQDTTGKGVSAPGGISRLVAGPGLMPAADLRAIDGISLGLAYKVEGTKLNNGQANTHKVKALHSVSTKSFVIGYDAEFNSVFKNADLQISTLADINGNIMNYFGKGNDTEFEREGDFRKFFRTNFSFYKLDPAFRVALSEHFSLRAGPSLQYFVYGDNQGRFIENPVLLGEEPDLFREKAHAGLVLNFEFDKRDESFLPGRGYRINVLAQAYEGLNRYSGTYAQLFPQVSFYKALNRSGTITLANRTGAGFTIGNTAFYQHAFLGSEDALLGFRKNRFAGEHSVYNNLEARIEFSNPISSLIPGKTGFIGFYDAGRVWVKGEHSNTIHQALGGGLFFVPFNKIFIRGIAGFSNEGMQATVALRQRF